MILRWNLDNTKGFKERRRKGKQDGQLFKRLNLAGLQSLEFTEGDSVGGADAEPPLCIERKKKRAERVLPPGHRNQKAADGAHRAHKKQLADAEQQRTCDVLTARDGSVGNAPT